MTDPRDPSTGPTADEKVQVWSALHPLTRLCLVIVGLAAIAAGVLYQIFGK